jgi:hypothetical protein
MIIRLERAIPDDVQDYLFLYKQEHLNLIYTWEGSEERSMGSRSHDWYFGDEGATKITKDDFYREIFSPNHCKFMIRFYEDKKSKYASTIGYIEVERIRNSTYRIIDWVMTAPQYKNMVWKALLKEKLTGCKKFSIYMSGDKPTVEWLENLGFKKPKSAQYGIYTKQAFEDI